MEQFLEVPEPSSPPTHRDDFLGGGKGGGESLSSVFLPDELRRNGVVVRVRQFTTQAVNALAKEEFRRAIEREA